MFTLGLLVRCTVSLVNLQRRVWVLREPLLKKDSKHVVNDIVKDSQGRYSPIISEIKLRASRFNCNFNFEGRSANGKHIA